jgi:hypothetical protein
MANPYQTALMDQLGGRAKPKNGNTGISGYGLDPTIEVPGLQAPPSFVPTEGPGPMTPAPAVDTKGPMPQAGAFQNRLGGFDSGKLSDASHNTPKYVFARHAQNFDDRDPSSRDALIQALRGDASGFFKDASLEGDILKGSFDPDTGGYGDVDIIKGLKAGGEGWQWGAMPGSVQGGGAPPVSAPQSPMTFPTLPEDGGFALPPMDDMQGRSAFLEALLQQLNDPTNRRML